MGAGATSHGLLDQVDSIIEQAKAVVRSFQGDEGSLIQSRLVRYGCLLTCAAIEQAIIDAASSYAERHGDTRLRDFVGEVLRAGRNPSPSYIKDVLSRFDKNWGSHIETFIADEVGEDKIKSIVSNRNRIAHGQSVSMGVASLIQWAPAARKLCLEILRLTNSAHRT